MMPFENLLFFYIMGIALIPAIVLGILGKRIKLYGIFVSILMFGLFIGRSKIQLIYFIIYYLYQLLLIYTYLHLRKINTSRAISRVFILLSVLPLIIVKISPLFERNIIGFIGISYITFKTVQIIIEIYDGLIEKVSIIDFTYFIVFFPSLSSGPIDRSRDFEKSINNKIDKAEYINEYIPDGVYKIFRGVLYKFIIANIINSYWLMKIPSEHSFINILNYMYAYSLYLFFDFAGYSAMAIGTGYILGVKLPENFSAPFISRNMKEFWNRWHMSLSFWFRDFIYTRFVMQFMKKKRFKSRFTASYVAYLITMLTMGIWHGFKIFYLIYGLYMALALIITDFFQRKNKLYKKYKNKTWWKVSAIIINFHVACFGLLLFSGYLYNK